MNTLQNRLGHRGDKCINQKVGPQKVLKTLVSRGILSSRHLKLHLLQPILIGYPLNKLQSY